MQEKRMFCFKKTYIYNFFFSQQFFALVAARKAVPVLVLVFIEYLIVVFLVLIRNLFLQPLQRIVTNALANFLKKPAKKNFYCVFQ